MSNRFAELTRKLRDRLGVSLDRRLDVGDLLLRLRISGLIRDFKIVPASALPKEVDARWEPADRIIAIRDEVFALSAAGDANSRFTIAHEVAHAILNHSSARNRKAGGKTQFGSLLAAQELEADDFAVALLAPPEMIDLVILKTPEQVAADFGLPISIANAWFAVLANEPGRSLPRPKPDVSKRRVVLIDTGDYADATWAMMRNREK